MWVYAVLLREIPYEFECFYGLAVAYILPKYLYSSNCVPVHKYFKVFIINFYPVQDFTGDFMTSEILAVYHALLHIKHF